MRVLHVSEVTWGGVVSLLRDFTAEQIERGDQVSLLTPPTHPAVDAGVRRVDWSLDRSRPSTYPRALAQVRSTVRRVRPEVVHVHSAFAGFFGRLPWMGTAESSVVYQPHAWSFNIFEGATLRTAAQRWERCADRRTDMLVANCDDEIAEGRPYGVRAPARALGVAVDVEHFHPVEPAERARHRQELGTAGRRAVLCLARLARQKGQDLLVAAWEANPLLDTVLWLVGPGDPEPLRALAPTQWGHSIRWVGEQDDVRPWIWASDLLVLSSRYETVAVVLAEAMACETPVVAVGVNGAAMAVSDGPHAPGGVVVAPGDTASLLAVSAQLLDDPDRLSVLASAGRERVRSLFSTPVVVDRLAEAYAAAIEEQQ